VVIGNRYRGKFARLGGWRLNVFALEALPSRWKADEPSLSRPEALDLILGLIFGLVTCTWVFSGLLSMEPFDITWLANRPPFPE
jgi:hypothetical protein